MIRRPRLSTKEIIAEDDICGEDYPDQNAPEYTEELLEEIDTVSVEVPLLAFEEFLPRSNPTSDANIDIGTLDGLDLSELCIVLNKIAEPSDCGRQFKVVENHPEAVDVATATDLALYPTDIVAQKTYSHHVANQTDHVARCAWAWILCSIKVDRDEEAGYGFDSQGPSKSGKIPLLRETPKSRGSRAQFLKSCTEIMLRQHRTHVFAIYLSKWNARFFRFDRAGCIVSRPINVQDSFAYFRNLVYRLVHLTSAELGFDDTVKLADVTALRALRAHHHDVPHTLRQYYEDYLNPDTIRWPIHEVTCPVVNITGSPDVHQPQENGAKTRPATRTYLIGRPSAGHYSLIGRATRGYIAFEVETGRMVFLKDSWRAVTRKHTELSTYQRLHSAGVESIATPIAGGDVDHHRTLSQRLMQDRPAIAKPIERVHTRLVIREIGRPLESYEGSFELISFVFHAYLGHQDAWEKAGVLHHDVSAANILIDVDSGYGFMNDWDLAKYREDLKRGAQTSEPGMVSGTWLYKSALALRYPHKPAELAEDIESFIYIILYFAMRFHAHSLATAPAQHSPTEALRSKTLVNHDLLVLYDKLFHAGRGGTDGVGRAGFYKELYIKAAAPPVQLDDDDYGRPTPLARLLEKAYQLLHHHYQRVDTSALERPVIRSTGSHADAKAKMAKLDRVDDEKGGPNLRSKWGMLERRPVIKNQSAFSDSTPSLKASLADPRPLDTHDAFLHLLDSAFVNDDGTAMNISKWRADKVPDQLFGQMAVERPPEKPKVAQRNIDIAGDSATHDVRRSGRVAREPTKVSPMTRKRRRTEDHEDASQPRTAAAMRKARLTTLGERTKAKARAKQAPVCDENYSKPLARRSPRLAAKASKDA